jgi:hypothetical protein
VTVTVYDPNAPEHDRVDVPELPRFMLSGFSEHANPVDGEIDHPRFTGPVKPPRLVTVVVEVLGMLGPIVSEPGLEVTLKSVTPTWMLTECDM